jgi:transposase
MVTALTLPDLDTLDQEALKALILAQHERLLSREHEIEHLKLLIAKLQRLQFGRKSEKIQHQIEQLELRLEDLQANQAENSSQPSAATSPTPVPTAKPARRPLPEHLPRETHKHDPQQQTCPDCGGALHQFGALFPVPAHQTGRAVFPHPAFRLASL